MIKLLMFFTYLFLKNITYILINGQLHWQVEVFKKLMPINNYRNEQPLNGRKVKMTN